MQAETAMKCEKQSFMANSNGSPADQMVNINV